MVNRYCSVEDVENYLDLSFDTTNYPKIALVEDWITASEDELDMRTGTSFDIGDEIDIISPQTNTNIIFLNKQMINSITAIYENTGDEYDIVWTTYSSSNYDIEDAGYGIVKLRDYFYGKKKLKVEYNAGHATIPLSVKEATLSLIKKRYYESILSISSLDTELVSISSIKVSEKSNSAIKFALDALNQEIEEKIRRLTKSNKYRVIGFGL